MARIRFDWLTGSVLTLGLLMAGQPVKAQTVFACEPEWGALTLALLPTARVFVATHAQQDPHHIEARPSLIAQLRSADAAICTGAELEAGWLPTLQQRSGNAKVQNGAKGLFLAASAVRLLQTRVSGLVLPFDGDIHPGGNPHLHADPRNLIPIARQWSQRLQELFPHEKENIGVRLKAFETHWNAQLTRWQTSAAQLNGMRIVVQHTSLAYLWAWVGIQPIADLEPRPGLAPTPGHLNKLLSLTREQVPQAIVVTSYQDPRAAQWLARQLGGKAQVLQLPATVEAIDREHALTDWFDRLLRALAGAQ